VADLSSVKFMLPLLQIDSDKAIMVTFKHDDKFQENSECAFQVMHELRTSVIGTVSTIVWTRAYLFCGEVPMICTY
jgi:hypothetical protein